MDLVTPFEEKDSPAATWAREKLFVSNSGLNKQQQVVVNVLPISVPSKGQPDCIHNPSRPKWLLNDSPTPSMQSLGMEVVSRLSRFLVLSVWDWTVATLVLSGQVSIVQRRTVFKTTPLQVTQPSLKTCWTRAPQCTKFCRWFGPHVQTSVNSETRKEQN